MGRGGKKKSFTFEDVVPAEILDPDTKREEAVSYFCRYDLNLPEAFAIDGEAFIGITRINNSSPIKVETPTKESFVFVSLGNFDGKYEDSGESYLKGFSPRKSDADSFNHLLSAEKGEVNEWSPFPFKPFFALSSSTPVPVSNFAVYLGMVLVAGFSIFFFRRWMG